MGTAWGSELARVPVFYSDGGGGHKSAAYAVARALDGIAKVILVCIDGDASTTGFYNKCQKKDWIRLITRPTITKIMPLEPKIKTCATVKPATHFVAPFGIGITRPAMSPATRSSAETTMAPITISTVAVVFVALFERVSFDPSLRIQRSL